MIYLLSFRVLKFWLIFCPPPFLRSASPASTFPRFRQLPLIAGGRVLGPGSAVGEKGKPRTTVSQLYDHSFVLGISIPKTLVIRASPVTLTLAPTQIAKVTWETDAHITRVLGMGMPKTRGWSYLFTPTPFFSAFSISPVGSLIPG